MVSKEEGNRKESEDDVVSETTPAKSEKDEKNISNAAAETQKGDQVDMTTDTNTSSDEDDKVGKIVSNKRVMLTEVGLEYGDEWREEYNHPMHSPDRFRHSLPIGMVLPSGIEQKHFEHDHHLLKVSNQVHRRWKKHSTDRVERRLRDFYFAQNRRHQKYGDSHPWGIMGLYAHLSGIRNDIEWAEDAAWRRENDEPYFSWSDWDEQHDHSWWSKPFCTIFVLIACTGTLLWGFYLNGWKIEDPKTNPMIGPGSDVLIRMGGRYTSLIIENGEWWRLVTPMFLHAGVAHYGMNMVALWFLGSAIEHSHGSLAMALHFVLPATFGTILSAIFIPQTITVGASGGIFGLMGACVADIITNWSLLFSKQVNVNGDSFLRHVKIIIVLILDAAVNCLIGLTPYIDNFNHMGGFVMGFLCGLSTGHHMSRRFFGIRTGFLNRLWENFVRFFGLILSVGAIMISVATLAQMDSTDVICTKCRYISCAPFPFWVDVEDQWWHCDDCDKLGGFNVTKNIVTGYYETIKDMTCPDGQVISVDISGDFISDLSLVQDSIPTYCRDNCEGKLRKSISGY